jgi:single-stranded-DNA-specific exonuclease
MERAAVREPILPEDIGFRLGPRLNAAGRLHTADKALRLLLTTDEAEANELADLLDSQNRERQELERQTLAQAEEKIALTFDAARDAAIVVGARNWHPGVLGIVAARIVRQYHRPAIVIGFDNAGAGKGSARSLEGFSLVGALQSCREHLEKFGGHEMAAGLSLDERKFDDFRAAFRQVARELLSEDQLRPSLQLDHELTFSEVNGDLLRWHERLQPFGRGNEQPLFFARGVEPTVEPQVLKEKHLALRLRQRGHFQRAIFFHGARMPLPPSPWDIAFQIKPDEYEGMVRVQLQVQAMRTTAPM